MDAEVDCYDNQRSGESNVATPAKYVKGLGRGQMKPIDPMTIRLPKFLMENIENGKTRKPKAESSGSSYLSSKIKNEISILNSYIQSHQNSKQLSNARSVQTFDSDPHIFDWPEAKKRSSQGSRSSSFSALSSTADDVKSLSVNDKNEWPTINNSTDASVFVSDKVEWPAITSKKTSPDSSKESESEPESKEILLDFKSVGRKLLSTNGDHAGALDVDKDDKKTDEQQKQKDNYKLCVQNIPYTITETDLMGALSTYGTVNSCQIFQGTDNHAMAIVVMDSQKACDWAVSCLHGEESPFSGYEDGDVPKLSVIQIKECERR
ncbi:uncharacterized protein LOC117122808 [Anneissia japonica]|uniref:uncharacterized protein LOC117122808 n=1 Tax=Anneissia japonica TaxID=1529436 RepID=UPI0014259C2F|nr:uncharacterized protein LOC117122808 [Anneissia japonica]XP_033124451.1 uncharacterized protein LOC117122808 [Anneissia japonica]XP_033124452.1 uncharacterized protein LOC117122808 [Anneissia japonica]XP_033124453.1 uncharacterized protein LOC117122808 [Anneissia japonica]